MGTTMWQEQQTLDSQRDKSFYLCTNTGAHTSFTMVPVNFQGNNIQWKEINRSPLLNSGWICCILTHCNNLAKEGFLPCGMANCKQYFYVRLSWWGCLCILLYGFNSSWRDQNILASLGKSSKLWWTTVQIMLGPRYVVVPFTSIYSLPSLVGKQNKNRFNNCQCPISYLISHNLPLQGPSASAYITYAREEVCALFRCHCMASFKCAESSKPHCKCIFCPQNCGNFAVVRLIVQIVSVANMLSRSGAWADSNLIYCTCNASLFSSANCYTVEPHYVELPRVLRMSSR